MHARFAAVAVLAALTIPVAACSTNSPATAPPTSTATKAAADPDAGLPTGARLKSALAPAAAFGTGFTLDATGSRDTGSTYQAPAKTKGADCTHLGGTSWTDITGIAGVSFAQNDYVDKATSDETAQEIDAYQGTTAATVLTALGKTATTCPTYHDAQTSSTVHVTEQATKGLGDGAYTITLSDSAWQTPTTLVAARVGTSVVTTMSTHSKAAATTVAQKIVTALSGS